MRIECREVVESYLANLKEGFSCVGSGERLRIVTPYLYPDNDLVEIFVEENPSGQVQVTDLGEATRHLHVQGFDPFQSPKRKFMIETITSKIGVNLVRGQITKSGEVSKLGELILDVIIAVRGVSDLIYMSKAYEPATFVEEVSAFLNANKLPVKPKAKLTGISGKVYTVHFEVEIGPRFVQALSPVAVAGLKPKVDATVRMWVDCNHELAREQKVTLLNDVDFEWKPYDTSILDRLSIVRYWTRKESLADMLRSTL